MTRKEFIAASAAFAAAGTRLVAAAPPVHKYALCQMKFTQSPKYLLGEPVCR